MKDGSVGPRTESFIESENVEYKRDKLQSSLLFWLHTPP